MDRGFISAGGHAVAADAANLSLLELVVVAANPTRVLPLSLPHNCADPMLSDGGLLIRRLKGSID